MDTARTDGDDESSGNSMREMIDEARSINERGRRSTKGAKFMAELLEYITSESKRRSNSVTPSLEGSVGEAADSKSDETDDRPKQ
jgi:hypothetical protein